MNYWKEKRVLVTGIDGFAGSWLAETLLQEGAEVHGLIRMRAVPQLRNISNIRDKITLHTGDLMDLPFLLSTLEKNQINTVFHLAAQSYVPQSFNAPLEAYNFNIIGTANMLEAIRLADKTTIEAMHFAGSSEEYGLVKENEVPIKESNPLRPLSPYAVSKVAGDLMCFAHYKAYGIPVVRTRGFNHTGPRRGEMFVTSVVARQVAEAKLFGKKTLLIGNTAPVRDFTDVRDMVRGYMLAVEKGEKGDVYNLGSGKGITIKELCEKAIKEGGVEMKIEVDEKRFRPAEVMILICDNSKAKKELGWAPQIPFEKTLNDLINYWITQLQVKK